MKQNYVLAILLYSGELSIHPLVDIKFKNFCFLLKILKTVFRCFVHFPVLFIDKYRYGENRVASPN
jgi:hypothetical protein